LFLYVLLADFLRLAYTFLISVLFSFNKISKEPCTYTVYAAVFSSFVVDALRCEYIVLSTDKLGYWWSVISILLDIQPCIHPIQNQNQVSFLILVPYECIPEYLKKSSHAYRICALLLKFGIQLFRIEFNQIKLKKVWYYPTSSSTKNWIKFGATDRFPNTVKLCKIIIITLKLNVFS
jgi:hypothetical protein